MPTFLSLFIFLSLSFNLHFLLSFFSAMGSSRADESSLITFSIRWTRGCRCLRRLVHPSTWDIRYIVLSYSYVLTFIEWDYFNTITIFVQNYFTLLKSNLLFFTLIYSNLTFSILVCTDSFFCFFLSVHRCKFLMNILIFFHSFIEFCSYFHSL